MDSSKQNFFSRFFGAFRRVEALELEKNNLEAFLNAFPGEYCGLSPDGYSVYSPGFCSIIGVDHVRSLADIQAVLGPGDSAALEGMMDRLQEHGTPFTLVAQSLDERQSFKLSGSKGENLAGTDHFLILWVEDITSEVKARDEAAFQQEEALQEFNQVRLALDSLPRPVWLRNTDQDLVWVNKTYCEYLGQDAGDVLEQQIQITAGAAKRKDKDQSDNGKALAAKALSEGTAQEQKLHGIFHGKRLLLRLSEIPLTGLGMTLGIAYNITREEELEAELKRFQLSTNELLEQMRSAIAIFDASQKLVFYNAAYSHLWGLESGWLDRQPKLGDIMEKLRETRRLPEQADFRAFKTSWLDMFTNLLAPREDMLYLPDGSALRMLIVPHSMGGIMMTFEDVTSRLALESSYNTLIAVQKETLDNLGEAVCVFGGDGRLKLWNPSYYRMWGFQPEDLQGEPHINTVVDKTQSFFSDEEWPDYKRLLTAKALSREPSEERLTCTPEDGDAMLLDLSVVPLPDGGVLMTYIDVTSTVEVENALREKAQALETAEQLKLDFLANVSYQLRTPLSSIMGFTDILNNEYFGPLNDRQKDYTTDIRSASERLLELINNILDLSTLEAGYLTLDRSEFAVKDMLGRVFDLVNDWARKDEIKVVLDCPDDIGTLNADERRIRQAMVNLVRNAIAFTPEGGEITLRARAEKSAIHLIVSDNGAGIAAEDKARIFEPFERAQTGKNARLTRSGAGIGLSLVQRIAEAHSGHVELDSDEGAGTTVTLIIPMTSTKTSLKIPAKGKAKV